MREIDASSDDRFPYAVRAEELFNEHRQAIFQQTDRLFCKFLVLQYVAGIFVALWISPLTWAGAESDIHQHIWAAIFLGAAIISLPVFLAVFQSGQMATRHCIAVGQMLMGALLIHLTGGRPETHFHIFGSLAILAIYRDWRVLITASAIVAVDHFVRGMYWPFSAYGSRAVSQWRWVEHEAWVVFEDVFLIIACVRSMREMRAIAMRRAKLEDTNKRIEDKVDRRTSELAASNHNLQMQIAARQETEKLLRTAQAELEQKVLERTAELAHINESLKAEIKARQQFESQLRQSQKMEVVGHLAGGIAHDFNNLLLVINGQAEILFNSLRTNFGACCRIQEITKAGEKAAQLTRQLLAFSRQQILRPRVLNLNELVSDFQRMLGRLIGEDITLVTRLSPDLRKIKADPGQLEQVLMNLAINARDAMPNGGEIIIETMNAELDESYIPFHPEAKPGHYTLLVVSDTGCGMDRDTMGHIFEPFFTTKTPGKGTGLGLATAYGIVKQSGGYIDVYSEVGHGTCFKIYLPPTNEGLSIIMTKSCPVAPTGNETVLVVEDEDTVRSLLRGTLKENGYNVLEASHGTEALEVVRAHTGPIHLMLSDVVMPGMGGRDLAQEFAVVHADAKIVLMSGYTDDMVMRHGVIHGEIEFLQKPYTMAALLAKIREVLDQSKPKSRKPKTQHATCSPPS